VGGGWICWPGCASHERRFQNELPLPNLSSWAPLLGEGPCGKVWT